jgi:hypothetical protein
MKPLATLGDVMQGVTSWRADLRALGVERRASPASERATQPDRGYVAQPGELPPPPRDTDVFPPPSEPKTQTLVKVDRAQLIERAETAVPKKRARVHRGREYQLETVRELFASGWVEGSRDGTVMRLAEKRGVAPGLISNWAKLHGPDIRAESKTLLSAPTPPPASAVVSAPVVSASNVDQAAKNLVDVLGAYITAVIDVRVNEAIAERMKRLM